MTVMKGITLLYHLLVNQICDFLSIFDLLAANPSPRLDYW